MAPNPNPSRITAASWWFMEQLLALEPSNVDQNGGIYANKPGYHNTRSANSRTNYSVQLAADKRGPSDKAAAYDWTFTDAQSGRYGTIMKYASRLLRSGQDPNDPRLEGWREFYGQADWDQAVEGWDFQEVGPRSSDTSHLWHIHLSELRENVESFDNKTKMLSVLRGETYTQYLESLKPPTPKGVPEMAGPYYLPEKFAYDAGGNLIDRSGIVSFVGEWTSGGFLNLGNGTATIHTHWTIDESATVKKALILPEIAYADGAGKIQWARQPIIELSHYKEAEWVHLSGGQFGVSFGFIDNDYDFSVPVSFNVTYGPRQ